MSKKHEYALYAGEDFIASGTDVELAEIMGGVDPKHIHYLSTPAHQRKLARSKRPAGRAKYTIKLGPSDEI